MEPEQPIVGEDAIEDAWAAVEADWADEDAHRRFISVTEVLGRLDEAGARYRSVRERDPERAEDAARRIDQIVGRALATLHANRVSPPAAPRRWLLFIAVALSLALVLVTMWVIRGL